MQREKSTGGRGKGAVDEWMQEGLREKEGGWSPSPTAH